MKSWSFRGSEKGPLLLRDSASLGQSPRPSSTSIWVLKRSQLCDAGEELEPPLWVQTLFCRCEDFGTKEESEVTGKCLRMWWCKATLDPFPSIIPHYFYSISLTIPFLGGLQQCTPNPSVNAFFLLHLAHTLTNRVISIKYKSNYFTPQPNRSTNPHYTF